MKEINRFYIMGNKLPLDDGPPVSFKDHAAIVAVKDALIAALQEQVRALASENSKLRDWLISDTMCEVDETAFPATDAALREIRAQAVESFMSWSNSHIEEGDEYEKQLREVSSACKVFAARIRAGEQP